MLAPQRPYDFVDEVVHQVLQVGQSGMLPLLNVHQLALISLVLGLGFFQLGHHLVVPLFDAFEHALVFVVLVLADLLFGLLNLFLLEGRQRRKVIRQLLDSEVGLHGVLLVAPVAIRYVMAECNCLFHDLLKGFLEHTGGHLITDLGALFALRPALPLVRFLLRHADFLRLGLRVRPLLFFLGRGLRGLRHQEIVLGIIDASLLQSRFLRF